MKVWSYESDLNSRYNNQYNHIGKKSKNEVEFNSLKIPALT